eukprot:9610902-Lingulodinium_polyedra.AAC.1
MVLTMLDVARPGAGAKRWDGSDSDRLREKRHRLGAAPDASYSRHWASSGVEKEILPQNLHGGTGEWPVTQRKASP